MRRPLPAWCADIGRQPAAASAGRLPPAPDAWAVPELLALLGGSAAAVIAAVGSPALLKPVVLLLLAPVAEEIVFRRGMQESLLARAPAAVANGLTAMAFGAIHSLAHQSAAALAVALPALLIGTLYQRKRRLAPCVALHAGCNAVWLLWHAS